MADMMALRAHTRGGPEVLVYEAAPRPTPGDGELLIAVHAAAITFAELTWPETWTSGGRDRTPIIPSHEFCGVVAEVGGDAADFAVGDQVYGLVPFDRDGAAAEYVAVPQSHVAAKPGTLSHVVAAALPLPALTAWQTLVDHAAVQPGHRVLVHGSGGAVGAFVTQLGASLGARVTGTAFSADAERVRAFGAERVIDVERERIDAETEAFDVAVDAVGRGAPDALFAALRRGGTLITLQEPASQETADRYGVRTVFFIVAPDRTGLTRMADLADAGKLDVPIAGTFPLSKGRAAFESRGQRPHPPGKAVLVVRD
jgi:NADPH:quinone reductase-like Zn-dependent oxidoreductase